MTPEQKRAAQEFESGRGYAPRGPFAVMLRSPEVMLRAKAMGDYLRFRNVLPERIREMVILVTAREWTQDYEWFHHYKIALKDGLAKEIAEDKLLQEQLAQEQAELEAAEASDPELIAALPQSLDVAEMESCIETLLFLSDKPVSVDKLRTMIGEDFPLPLYQEAMTNLRDRYGRAHHGIEIVEISGGLQFRTKPGRAALARKLAKIQIQRLSGGAMESLAIIAYRQPIMKEEIDKIRGVDSSYFIRLLMDRGFRRDTMQRVNQDALKYSTLPMLEREYSLYEIAVLTRAGPARSLGLKDLGHVGPGAKADITVYKDDADREAMFTTPLFVFKNGELIVRDGKVIKVVNGATHVARPEYNRSIEKPLKDYFDRYHTVRMENFRLSDEEIIDGGRGEIIVQPTKARATS
jgi:segregation and condensation protein B